MSKDNFNLIPAEKSRNKNFTKEEFQEFGRYLQEEVYPNGVKFSGRAFWEEGEIMFLLKEGNIYIENTEDETCFHKVVDKNSSKMYGQFRGEKEFQKFVEKV